MKKVLVLGSSGRVGTLVRHSWQRTPLDTPTGFEYQTRGGGGLIWDVLGPPTPQITGGGPYDCMIVLSGVVPGVGADLSLNTALGLAGLRAAVTLGIGRVLLASSSAVYGNHSDVAFSEGDATRPVNDYGRAKLEMEQACQAQAQHAGIELCCLRIGNVAGADALLLNGAALAQGASLTLDQFADGGTPLRSYIGPQTLAGVLGTLVHSEAALPEVLNIGAPSAVEMGALADAAGLPVTLVPKEDSSHQRITLNCDRLAALHHFDTVECSAAGMVAQWQALCA